MTQLRHAIAEELRKIWCTLSDNVEGDMDGFADKLFEGGIISKDVRKSKNFNTMMDAFVSIMGTFERFEEYKEHCLTLLAILDDIGGGARHVSLRLKESWEIVVRNTILTDFSF